MPLRFCANLSFLYPEISSILQRYEAARKTGFRAVECAFLYDVPVEEVVKAKENSYMEQILINADPGSPQQMGFAAAPKMQNQFMDSLEISIKYAKALKCNKIHLMSGKDNGSISDPTIASLFEANLRHAVEVLKEENIVGLVEPINGYDLPGYALNDFDKAVEIVKKIDSPFLKLQLDIYHLQILSGNLTRKIIEYLPIVGHIQVSQVPARSNPAAEGEINYKYIFKLLQQLEYDGWIGLEYTPSGDTNADVKKWISEMGVQL